MSQAVNPAMIVLARESRGITQLDLAEHLSITQGHLSKLETGYLNVSPDMLTALAKELNFPESFFYINYEVYPAKTPYYRKHKTLPKKELDQIVAWMNIHRFHVIQLLQSAEVEYSPLPQCDLDDYEGSPAKVAAAVREYLKLPSGPIKSMTDVIEDAGILVIPFKAGSRKFAGASMEATRPNYVILINEDMPGDRMRWTLAHELGHLVMHRLPSETMEEEADEFASEFLMPTREVAPYLTNLDPQKLAGLKQYWKTSIFSIVVHANRLGYLPDRQYRTMITKLAQLGITRTQEPPELAIPRETPSLLKELIEYHSKDLGFSPAQMSSLLWLNSEEYLQTYKVKGNHLRLVQAAG
ncbi:MAG: XRE family transcriptional regulator [Acidobacteriota bacterium]|nr:XRE family transcriptional regulator [Acidobacteriota bacterium]